MKILTIVFYLMASLVHAEPQAPIVRQLEAKKITIIPIHSGMDTLLIFPKPVRLVLGFGLTDGKVDGVVQYQHEGDPKKADPKLVILRQLKEGAEPVMQIMLDGEEEAYVYRLQPSEKPASVIRYVEAGKDLVASELTKEELAKLRSKPSKARQAELMRLTAEAYFLEKRIPEEYEGFQTKAVRFASVHDGVTITSTRVACFANEDALIVLGRIRNLSKKPFILGNHSTAFRLGSLKTYFPTQLLVSKRKIAPGEEAEFRSVIIGDGEGGPGHFSLENRITLELEK